MLSRNRFKKGAASFYIVAISTLVLVIVSASFAAVIISELARTSNNDLAQSAYDSAMAGVEDAKLAYYNYIQCRDSGASKTAPNGNNEVDCGEIMYYIEEGQDCDMVAHILGRIQQVAQGEVLIKETTNGDDKMLQAYTCAKINKNPDEYIDNLSGGGSKAIKVDLGEGAKAADINYINIQLDPGTGEFPIVGFGIIQTAENFKLEDFDMARGEGDNRQTDRGTVFLVPYKDENELSGNTDEYINAFKDGKNSIDATGFLNSNNKTPENKPYAVRCANIESGKNCEVTIELPQPVGGSRSDSTFMIVRSAMGDMSKGQTLHYSFCTSEQGCSSMDDELGDGMESEESSAVPLKMQVTVDSTGRANDLFRRVEAVLEDTSAVSGSSLGLYNAVQADEIHKIEYALCEAKFGVENCDQQ